MTKSEYLRPAKIAIVKMMRRNKNFNEIIRLLKALEKLEKLSK